jgi:FkbM family methyltransferase
MKYKIRRILNKISRGKWLKLRSFFSTKVKDDLEYYINTDIGNKLYFEGDFEKNELQLCAKYINENSIVIDIGANIGIHSIYFAKIATKGKILSIEPQVAIYPTLLKNISNFNNIIPLNIAIYSKMKISEFFITSDNAYSSLKDTKRKKVLQVKQVVTMPLDSLIDLFDKVDFIKIDVEGFEKNVLLSMENILKRDKPTLFIEIYKGENSNPDPEGTIRLLTDMGYKAYIVNHAGSLEEFVKHNDSYYNYFFIYGDNI